MNYSAGQIVVAMSGGVDSSVAALLCSRASSALAGITLRLSDQDPREAGEGRCCAVRDVADARRVASDLGLPHYVLDLRRRFEDEVIAPFVREYLAGRTPIPCVACNDTVKFEDLLSHARSLGAARVATGHYARIEEREGRLRLLRAVDRARDQTYFLHGLSQEQLRAAEFPLGAMAKAEVREIARQAGLATCDKPDSREICFVPGGDTGAFVERRAEAMGLPVRAGELVGVDGAPRGVHLGVHRFTVGQRRGLGAHGEPAYAVELRPETAEVVVGTESDLLARAAFVERFRWVAGEPPPGPIEVMVQVRHGRREAPARLTPVAGGRPGHGDDCGGLPGAVRAEFLDPERAVAPGQFLVAYRGEECLGGGAITRSERA